MKKFSKMIASILIVSFPRSSKLPEANTYLHRKCTLKIKTSHSNKRSLTEYRLLQAKVWKSEVRL